MDTMTAKLREQLTSGSVRQRPIAMIPDVRIPSVKKCPKNPCIFGVRRNGTTSLVAKTGTWLETPVSVY